MMCLTCQGGDSQRALHAPGDEEADAGTEGGGGPATPEGGRTGAEWEEPQASLPGH